MELFIWEVNYNLNNKQKKQYTPFKNDILTGSVENFSSYIDGGNDDWDDPIIDPDDEIDW